MSPKHPDNVPKYPGTVRELAGDISRMRYNTLAKFLKVLTFEVDYQSIEDRERGRVKLANALLDLGEKLEAAQQAADAAWEICKPYMKEK